MLHKGTKLSTGIPTVLYMIIKVWEHSDLVSDQPVPQLNPNPI